MILGQVATETKSNEVEAIPMLLDKPIWNDCVVTIDAMGFPTKTFEKIVAGVGDDLLSLKGNQETLGTEEEEASKDANARNCSGLDSQSVEACMRRRQRIETRRDRTLGHRDGVSPKPRMQNTNTIGMAEARRRAAA